MAAHYYSGRCKPHRPPGLLKGLGYLTESLRLEEDDLRLPSFEAIDETLESIRSRRVRAYLKGLKGAVHHAG